MLFISFVKLLSRWLRRAKLWWRLTSMLMRALVVFVVGVVVLVSTMMVSIVRGDAPFKNIPRSNLNNVADSISRDQFVITIDGGSSGSRIHVHKVIGSDDSETSVPLLLSVFTYKLKPGLSSYENEPMKSSISITELLNLAINHVPRTHWRRTPVFLKATAGLRSIPTDAAQEILEHCRIAIEKTAFWFKPQWAAVISGNDEGKFGWIAANYLLERFTHQKHKGFVGVIEMGGASMQISFVPNGNEANSEFIVPVAIGGVDYDLYTHSFLGFGLEQAFENLEQKFPLKHNVCMSPGSRPSASGNFDKCLDLISALLNTEKYCRVTPCSFDGVYQPSLTDVDFVAIENFFHTAEFFNVTDKLSRLDDKARIFCQTDFTKIVNQNKGIDANELSKYCFSAAYIYSVLIKGFNVSEPFRQIRVLRDVKGTDIDWAVGSVLYEVMSMQPLGEWPTLDIFGGTRGDITRFHSSSNTSFSTASLWVIVLPTVVVSIAFVLLRGMQKQRRYLGFARIAQERSMVVA